MRLRAPGLVELLTLLALAGLVLALAGCSRGDDLELRDWTFEGDGPPRAVRLPGQVSSWMPPRPGSFTLSTEVALPPGYRGAELSLTWPLVYTLAELHACDTTLLPLALAPFDVVRPSSGRLYFRIPAACTGGERLDLSLVVPYRGYTSGLFPAAPTLDRGAYGAEATRSAAAWENAVDYGVLGIFLVLLVAGLASFALDRRRVADGWFALMTAGIVLWHVITVGLSQILDPHDLIHVPGLSTAVITVAGISLVGVMFKAPPPRWILAFMLLAGAASFALSLRPFASHFWPVKLNQVSVLLALVYQLLTLSRQARRGDQRLTATWMLVAWAIVGLGALSNAIVTPPIRLAPFGWAAFAVIHAIALAQAHVRSLRALNAELGARVEDLEQRNRDVAVLNDELRRQVGDRSARLAEALSRVGQLAARSEPLRPGAVLNDRYRVVRPLGRGAMGEVYEVERTTDGRRVALKTLSHAPSGQALARLAREAEAAAKIRHPNVVGILDIDVSPTGQMFLVMELVSGHPLSDEHGRYGDVPWARGVLRQVAAGLRALHDAGVVHRDLKPHNVLLELPAAGMGGEVRARIADLGLARVSTESSSEATQPAVDAEAATHAALDVGRASSSSALTRTGIVMGTPLYMAPEMLDGVREAPPSSDMWSFGVLAYEVATGQMPFDRSPVEALAKHTTWSMKPIEAGTLPEPLARLIVRCLSVDPAARPTATEAEGALEAAG